MRHVTCLAVPGLALLVSACGGGGGGERPQPIAAPPAAAVPRNATMIDLTVSESFENAGAIVAGSLLRGPASVSDARGGPTPLTVDYDAGTKTYTVRAEGRSQSFGPEHRLGTNETDTVYSRKEGAVTDMLGIKIPGSTETSDGNIVLTYVNYGLWQQTSPGATANAFSQLHFVYGAKTAAADMPRSGLGVYKVSIGGGWADKTSFYTIEGVNRLDADFGRGIVTASMQITGISVADKSVREFGSLLGTGTINSATSSFNTPLSDGFGYTGSLNGFFFGPKAIEIGGAFTVANGQGGVMSGIVMGRRD